MPSLALASREPQPLHSNGPKWLSFRPSSRVSRAAQATARSRRWRRMSRRHTPTRTVKRTTRRRPSAAAYRAERGSTPPHPTPRPHCTQLHTRAAAHCKRARRTRGTERYSGQPSSGRVRWQDPYAWCSPPADHADQISITASGGCGLAPACLRRRAPSACSVGMLLCRPLRTIVCCDGCLRTRCARVPSRGSHADSAALGTTPYIRGSRCVLFGPWDRSCIQRACGATGSASTSAFLSATTTARLARQTTYVTLPGKRARAIPRQAFLMRMCRSLREAARRAGFCLCRSHA